MVLFDFLRFFTVSKILSSFFLSTEDVNSSNINISEWAYNDLAIAIL